MGGGWTEVRRWTDCHRRRWSSEEGRVRDKGQKKDKSLIPFILKSSPATDATAEVLNKVDKETRREGKPCSKFPHDGLL